MYYFPVLFLFIPVSLFAQALPSLPFDECNVDGSSTLYHLETDSWFYSDKEDANRETLPASTFKILHSAIALEMGIVADENEIIKWDGTENTFFGVRIAAWNEDIDMKRAFAASAIWFYVELAKRIPAEEYNRWLHKTNYGNGKLNEPGDDFWNVGEFGVSPVNQIEFLAAFYRGNVPFSDETYQTVKQLMISELADNYTIFGKTGWTKTETQDIGWWIGYAEKKNDTWFFATRITKNLDEEHPGFSACRVDITKNILHEKGVM